MNILITNDDGIHAPGLWALFDRFSKKHRVTVAAPDRERSAVGHGITLHKPLRAVKVSVNGGRQGYAVNGKPADCVKLGIWEIVDTVPDMVISGINPGANVGANINYSGTVAAAREGALCGLPAISVSVGGTQSTGYEAAADFIEKLALKVYENGLPPGIMLNVNFPDAYPGNINGIQISRQGNSSVAGEHYERRIDPRNLYYHWLSEDTRVFGNDLNVDEDALAMNYISITPIRCDMTDYRMLNDLKMWDMGGWGIKL